MPVVSITRLRIRSWRFLPLFFIYAVRSSRQAKNAPGNLANSLLPDEDRTYWTRTVWESESALKAYMLSGPHRQAMPRLMEWCDEAAVVRWEQDNPSEPDWPEAHRRLQAEGRRSKLKHPSPAHEAFQIRAPKPSN